MPDAKPSSAVSTGTTNLALLHASREAARKREELDKLLTAGIGRYTSPDTSLVLFGSLAFVHLPLQIGARQPATVCQLRRGYWLAVRRPGRAHVPQPHRLVITCRSQRRVAER